MFVYARRPSNSLLLQCPSRYHIHIFIPSWIFLFCVYFLPFQFAFASRLRHSLRSRCACRISITLSGRADTHPPADESREPAGEAGWKVRVQQLWFIDTGQDGEFSGQSCQLMQGCIGIWWRPSGARCTDQVQLGVPSLPFLTKGECILLKNNIVTVY